MDTGKENTLFTILLNNEEGILLKSILCTPVITMGQPSYAEAKITCP